MNETKHTWAGGCSVRIRKSFHVCVFVCVHGSYYVKVRVYMWLFGLWLYYGEIYGLNQVCVPMYVIMPYGTL